MKSQTGMHEQRANYSEEGIVDLLRQLDAMNIGPFPYKEIKAIVSSHTEYDDLIPDLNTFFYNIASHRTGLKIIPDWSTERLIQSYELLNRSFFKWHPEYLPLQDKINAMDTPLLYYKYTINESSRVLLVCFLSNLIIDKIKHLHNDDFLSEGLKEGMEITH